MRNDDAPTETAEDALSTMKQDLAGIARCESTLFPPTLLTSSLQPCLLPRFVVQLLLNTYLILILCPRRCDVTPDFQVHSTDDSVNIKSPYQIKNIIRNTRLVFQSTFPSINIHYCCLHAPTSTVRVKSKYFN